MSDRSRDWLAQARRDLEHARKDVADGYFEHACFESQQAAEKAVKAAYQRQAYPELVRVGLFGSYATGAYAPGSDIDLLVLVRHSDQPRWFMRAAAFDTTALPLGADLFVYTEAEADRMRHTSPWFQHVLGTIVWIDEA